MLIVRPISPGAAGYYFRGQGPGQWVGLGSGSLGLEGDVSRDQLTAILQGRHPADGRVLVALRPNRRRAGWDLTFPAPKSVSLLGALAPDGSGTIAAAHRAAVADVIGHIERHHLGVARVGAAGGRVPVGGAVAVAFEHPVNSASEPHLHSHVLLANLGQMVGGSWSALSGSDWWPARHALAALYQLGLRHHLGAAGWELDWRIRPDGLADVADVPRAAVRAASTQSRAAVSMGRYQGRRLASTPPWRRDTAAAGYGPGEAALSGRQAYAREAGRDLRLDGARLVAAVETRLAAERSVFRRAHVLEALAACCPEGASAPDAQAWAERFCDGCIRVASTSQSRAPRWTTELAVRADLRLVALADAPLDPPNHGRLTADAVRILGSTVGPVEILQAQAGCSNLLAHAAVLDGCRVAWEHAGLTVAIRTRTSDAAARWHALTGLEPRRAGDRPDVLIVDQADRWTTPELLALLSPARDAGTRTILVEGGTLPRLTDARSAGLVSIGERLGRVDPGTAPDWSVDPESLALEASGRGAARRLLDSWAQAWPTRRPLLLVGLGVDEVAGLNQAARSLLARDGLITGPKLPVRGRDFLAGDRVVLLRGLGSGQRRGTIGTVTEVDPRGQTATVAWRTQRQAQDLDRTRLARLGHAYAATPTLAAATDAPLLLLGDPVSVPHLRSRVLSYAHATRSPIRDDLTRHLRQPAPELGL